MTGSGPDHLIDAAYDWLRAVAERLNTDDLDYTHRLVRAWLHTVRDQLDVDGVAELANGLPALLRGEFYAGWEPGARVAADRFVARFGNAARVSAAEVRFGAVAVTASLAELLPTDRLAAVLNRLPDGVRSVLTPVNRFTSPALPLAVPRQRDTRTPGRVSG